jgi:hypothetical protein
VAVRGHNRASHGAPVSGRVCSENSPSAVKCSWSGICPAAMRSRANPTSWEPPGDTPRPPSITSSAQAARKGSRARGRTRHGTSWCPRQARGGPPVRCRSDADDAGALRRPDRGPRRWCRGGDYGGPMRRWALGVVAVLGGAAFGTWLAARPAVVARVAPPPDRRAGVGPRVHGATDGVQCQLDRDPGPRSARLVEVDADSLDELGPDAGDAGRRVVHVPPAARGRARLAHPRRPRPGGAGVGGRRLRRSGRAGPAGGHGGVRARGGRAARRSRERLWARRWPRRGTAPSSSSCRPASRARCGSRACSGRSCCGRRASGWRPRRARRWSSRCSRRSRRGRSGWDLLPTDGGLRVTATTPGGPAARAGLQVGDLVVSVGGAAAGEQPVADVLERPLPVVVELADGRELTVAP